MMKSIVANALCCLLSQRFWGRKLHITPLLLTLAWSITTKFKRRNYSLSTTDLIYLFSVKSCRTNCLPYFSTDTCPINDGWILDHIVLVFKLTLQKLHLASNPFVILTLFYKIFFKSQYLCVFFVQLWHTLFALTQQYIAYSTLQLNVNRFNRMLQ